MKFSKTYLSLREVNQPYPEAGLYNGSDLDLVEEMEMDYQLRTDT